MKRKTMRNLAEALRDEMHLQKKVIEVLKDGPKTVSEIADELEFPSAEVMRWVTAMLRYGIITEIPKSRADDYYQYKLVEE